MTEILGGARGGVVDEVRDRFVREGAPPTPAAVISAVRGHPATAALGDRALLHLAGDVHADLVGAGPLSPLLSEVDVTDVLVNGDEVWVDRGHGLVRSPMAVGTRADVRRLAQRLAAAGGRRLDDNSPCVDARLADGTRLHAVLPPIAPDGPLLSLRTFRSRPFTLADLVAAHAFTEPVAEALAAIVAARLAYLVTGGTGSGKSTLLATLLSLVPHDERIVLVEDSAELRVVHPHAVAMQARTANVEGAGRVELRDLVRQALRMRPDRLVVGECRGAEVVDLLAALNTGHEGGAGTLHANTATDVPARLEALGLLGGLPRPVLHAQVAAALQVGLHLRRVHPADSAAKSGAFAPAPPPPAHLPDPLQPARSNAPAPDKAGGGRVLDAIYLLLPSGSTRLVTAVPAWRRGAGPGPAAAALGRLLAGRGVTEPALLADRR